MIMRPLMRATPEQLVRDVGGALLKPGAGRGRVCLVVDADRTLAPIDTGRMVGAALGVDQAIRRVFETHGYVDAAFALVADVWNTTPVECYLAAIEHVAASIQVHSPWQEVWRRTRPEVPIVVVTAGIPQAWRRVLERLGWSDVPVVGGCHPGLDDYVVSSGSKADLVGLLQLAGWRVAAAGDSCIDLPMLQRADFPVFVPDHKGSPALRAELDRVPRVRHLVVDEQRFAELATCSTDDLVSLTLDGGVHHAA